MKLFSTPLTVSRETLQSCRKRQCDHCIKCTRVEVYVIWSWGMVCSTNPPWPASLEQELVVNLESSKIVDALSGVVSRRIEAKPFAYVSAGNKSEGLGPIGSIGSIESIGSIGPIGPIGTWGIGMCSTLWGHLPERQVRYVQRVGGSLLEAAKSNSSAVEHQCSKGNAKPPCRTLDLQMLGFVHCTCL